MSNQNNQNMQDAALNGASFGTTWTSNTITNYFTNVLANTSSTYTEKLASFFNSKMSFGVSFGVSYVTNYAGNNGNVEKTNFQTYFSTAGGLVVKSAALSGAVAGFLVNEAANSMWETWETFATEYPDDFLNFLDDPVNQSIDAWGNIINGWETDINNYANELSSTFVAPFENLFTNSTDLINEVIITGELSNGDVGVYRLANGTKVGLTNNNGTIEQLDLNNPDISIVDSNVSGSSMSLESSEMNVTTKVNENGVIKEINLETDSTNDVDDLAEILTSDELRAEDGAKVIITDSQGQQEVKKGYNNNTTEMVEGLGGDSNGITTKQSTDGESFFSLVSEGAETVINGVTYVVTEVVDSVVTAGEELNNFIESQVGDAVQWFTSGDLLNVTIANWMAANLQTLIDGNLTVDEAFIDMAEYVGEQHLGNFVIGSVGNVLEAERVIDDVFNFEGGLEVQVGDNSTYLGSQHAGAIYQALGRMAVDFAVNSQGWNSEQYAKAGVGTIASVVAYEYGAEYLGGGAVGAGAAAAATTLINGLMDSNDYNSSDWVMLHVRTAIAFAAGVSGAVVAAAILGAGAATGPVGLAIAAVVAAVVSLTGGKITEGLYKGKVYHNGEYGDLGALLNSIYEVETIQDENGNDVQILAATNPEGSTVRAIEGIAIMQGTNTGGEVLIGLDTQNETMYGLDGGDYLEGKGGEDAIFGGGGNDNIIGGSGDDVLSGENGDDIIFGDEGIDTILGGDGRDFIHGGSGDDIITAEGDSDIVLAGAGNDNVLAGDGDDLIDGGSGQDSLDGEAGDDVIMGNLGNDFINGGAGNDFITGDNDNDTLNGDSGDDHIFGGSGSDILNGGTGNDYLNGGDGDDFLSGGIGNDVFYHSNGEDRYIGGLGDDIFYGYNYTYLDGGLGNDTIFFYNGFEVNGGEGDDIYVINDLDAGYDTQGFPNANHYGFIESDTGGNDTVFLKDVAEDALISMQFYDNNLLLGFYSGSIQLKDHFVNPTIERIEFDNGNYIDLTNLTNPGVDLADVPYSVVISSDTSTRDTVVLKENIALEGLTEQNRVFSNTALQNFAEVSYEEALGDFIATEYYDNSEIISYYRNRGTFGGKYTIYKVVDNTEINTASDIYELRLLSEDLLFEYDYDSNSYASINETIDHYVDVGEFYTTIDNMNISTFVDPNSNRILLTKIIDNQVPTEPNFVYLVNEGESYKGINFGLASLNPGWGFDNTRKFGSFVVDGATELLVGNFGDEIIDGGGGDDILIGNGGDDEVNGGLGDDWLFGGDGDDTANGGEGDDSIFGGDGDDIIDGGNGDDAIIGGSGNDEIYGQGGNDWIDAGDGIDIIYGGDGDDIIYAGAGDDYAEGGAGVDVIYAQEGNDTIYGNEGTDYLYGEEGNDRIYGVEDADYLYGGTGSDVLVGNGDVDELYGLSGNDNLNGGEGADIIDGGDGFDLAWYESSNAAVTIDLTNNIFNGGYATGDVVTNIEGYVGSAFSDTLIGDSGNDWFYGFTGAADTIQTLAGNDYVSVRINGSNIDGGVDVDRVSFNGEAFGVTIDLSNNTAYQTSDNTNNVTISNFEETVGTGHNDNITGDTNDNILIGYMGDDIINGLDGNDTIYGMQDDDTINGGAGNDILDGESGNDTVNGGSGNDIITSSSGDDTINGDDGDDTIYLSSYNSLINGGAGTDTLSMTSLTSAITLSLVNNTATSSQIGLTSIFNLEQIVTGSGNDIIYGSTTATTFDGYLGNDKFYAGSAGDTIYGHEGSDTLISGAGADTLNGGSGFDYAAYGYSDVGVTIDLADSNLNSGGYATGDVLTDIEAVFGSNHNDYLYGNANVNHLIDASGDDFVYGRAGNDTLFSTSGTDHFDGGDGSDYISYSFSGGGVNVNLTTNTGSGASAEDDTYANIENISGSSHGDTLTGDAVANTIRGSAGNDIIDGGGARDIMYGDAGNDIFVFSDKNHSTDSWLNIIADFTKGQDIIDLSNLGYSSVANFDIQQISNETVVWALDTTTTDTFGFKLFGLHTLDDNDFMFV